MSDMISIPLDDASNKALFHYASVIMGLEVSSGANNTTLRAKILAVEPSLTEIRVPAAMGATPAVTTIPAPAAPTAAASGRKLTSHFRDDPKVEITVAETSDKTRAKEVQIAVNGDVIIVKRGHKVPIPYRFYLALLNAEERIGRETDEVNPITGLPIIEFVNQPSYVFSTHSMPSEEEIAAYHARCDSFGTEPAKAA